MKKLLLLLLCVPLIGFSQSFCNIYGSVKFVDFGQDYKIKFVEFGEDIKIKYVSSGANNSGKWKIVDFGENYKLKKVEFGEDFRVKIVSFGEGCNSNTDDLKPYDLKPYVNTYIPDGSAIGSTMANAVILTSYSSDKISYYKWDKKAKDYLEDKNYESNRGNNFVFTSNPLLMYIYYPGGGSNDCYCEKTYNSKLRQSYWMCEYGYNSSMIYVKKPNDFNLQIIDGNLYMFYGNRHWWSGRFQKLMVLENIKIHSF